MIGFIYLVLRKIIFKMVLIKPPPTFGYQVVCDKCLYFDMANLRYGSIKSRAGGFYHVYKGAVVS